MEYNIERAMVDHQAGAVEEKILSKCNRMLKKLDLSDGFHLK